MAKIIIKRKSSLGGAFYNHDVYLLNTFIGKLKNGGTLEIPVDVGSHTLTFTNTKRESIRNAKFNVVVNEEDEIVEINARFNMKGEYIVEYADNKPHIPTFHSSEPAANPDTSVETTNPNAKAAVQTPSGIRCPRCGSYDVLPVSEVSTKGKDFNTGNACCGLMLCGPLGLLFGSTGKGKQTFTTTYWMCKSCGRKFKA